MTLRAIIPSLLSADLDRTVAFYERMGFQRTGRYPNRDAPRWIELSRDGIALQFYAEPSKGMPDRPALSGTIYIACDNVDALAEGLRGVLELEWGPETMDYGQREFAIRDPDGYIIAFAQAD